MSGKLDWRRARLAGKPNLDHRHEFEFEDRAARWLRRADERRQRERRSVTPSRSCSSRLRICAASVGRHGDSLASTSLTSGANSNDNALRPVPLVLTNTLPFGKRLAFCSYNPDSSGRTITLNVPQNHKVLLADNNTLLHEMVHQFLFERGEYASHDGAPWRREIMRLTKRITGKEIWAGPVRQNGKAIRINASHPETG
jgi:hypothetical protein